MKIKIISIYISFLLLLSSCGANKLELKTAFLNDDHTGTLVPLFAFGTGAYNFTSTYDNTQLYQKILEWLNLH